MKFIAVKIKDYVVCHGFDSNNKEIEETVQNSDWAEKIISVDRIKSVSEKYILMDYAHGRWIYWEYQGGLRLMHKLLGSKSAGSTKRK